jgi:hypothetical protein
MIRKLLILLGLRRHPLPPIYRVADCRELARINALLAKDRKEYPRWTST